MRLSPWQAWESSWCTGPSARPNHTGVERREPVPKKYSIEWELESVAEMLGRRLERPVAKYPYQAPHLQPWPSMCRKLLLGLENAIVVQGDPS